TMVTRGSFIRCTLFPAFWSGRSFSSGPISVRSPVCTHGRKRRGPHRDGRVRLAFRGGLHALFPHLEPAWPREPPAARSPGGAPPDRLPRNPAGPATPAPGRPAVRLPPAALPGPPLRSPAVLAIPAPWHAGLRSPPVAPPGQSPRSPAVLAIPAPW